MPPNKQRKLERESLCLRCEFSECYDQCNGISEFSSHVKKHADLMKDQLQVHDSNEAVSEYNTDVDNTRCACPWRGCDAVLEHTKDWSHCVRHIYFHCFHTYIKCLGDNELIRRAVNLKCQRDSEKKNCIPDLPDPLECKWSGCNFSSDEAWVFYRHAESHGMNPSLDDTWTCHWQGCCYKASSTTKLKDHIHKHTQERRYACSHCGVLVSTSTRLEDHLTRQAPSTNNVYQCSHCSKQYAAERLLRDHLRKHVNLYNCLFCDMTCPSPSALRIHILYRHSTERPFVCDHCERRFKTKNDLASHVMTHDLHGSSVSCTVEHCGFVCKNIQTLMKHNKEVHKDGGRVFGCHICEDIFTSSKDISAHLRCVHDLKLPSGHVRFRFTLESDGIRRLVTVRYEGIQDDNPASEKSHENAAELPLE